MAVAIIVNAFELYTQHAAVNFTGTMPEKRVKLETHRFKIAQLFYTNRRPWRLAIIHQKVHCRNKLDQMVKGGNSRLTSYFTANSFWGIEIWPLSLTACLYRSRHADDEEVLKTSVWKLYEENGYSFQRSPFNLPDSRVLYRIKYEPT